MSALLQVRNISRSFRTTLAVDKVSFDVQPGELLGVSSRDAAGSFPDAVPVRVLADRQQYLAYRALDPPEVY